MTLQKIGIKSRFVGLFFLKFCFSSIFNFFYGKHREISCRSRTIQQHLFYGIVEISSLSHKLCASEAMKIIESEAYSKNPTRRFENEIPVTDL